MDNLTKYPLEVAMVGRPNNVCAFSANFFPAQAANDDYPLRIYDKSFSRISVAIMNTNGTPPVTGNLGINLLEDMFRRTDYAFNKHMDAECGYDEEQSQNETAAAITQPIPNEPAYTVTISSGKLKGLTPAQALLEGGEKEKLLRSQYDWLKGNVDKYPKNRIQIDAIYNAFILKQQGRLVSAGLQASEAKPKKVIKLYSGEPRSLIRKPRADGMCPVYTVEINWQVGEKTPVAIKIQNFFAPVITKEDGRIIPQISARDESTVKQAFMAFTAAEWLDVIRSIKAAMMQFEVMNSKNCILDAKRAEEYYRTNSKAS